MSDLDENAVNLESIESAYSNYEIDKDDKAFKTMDSALIQLTQQNSNKLRGSLDDLGEIDVNRSNMPQEYNRFVREFTKRK